MVIAMRMVQSELSETLYSFGMVRDGIEEGLLNWIKDCQYFKSQRSTADIVFKRDGGNTGTNIRKVNPCLERSEEF